MDTQIKPVMFDVPENPAIPRWGWILIIYAIIVVGILIACMIRWGPKKVFSTIVEFI